MVSVPFEALVRSLCSSRAGQNHVFLALVDACLSANQLDPFLCFRVALCLEVKVSRGGEQAKGVFGLALGVLLARDGCEVREGDLVAQLGLSLVAVYREQVGS